MKLYLMMNAALAVSLLVFIGVDSIFRKFQVRYPFRQSLRAGQLALLLSLLLPIVASYLPHAPRPAIPETLMVPLNEMAAGIEQWVAPTTTAPVIPGAAAAPTASFALNIDWQLLSTLLLFASILFALSKKLLIARKLQAQLRNAIQIKRVGKIQVVLSPEFNVPFSTLIGRRAWIALPEEMLLHWQDFKLAVLHELQHHRQHDTLWALAIEVLIAVFWGNPALYLWRRRLSELQELSCDEALIGRKVSTYEYGSCLVRVAEAALGNSYPLVGTAGMAGVSGNPKQFKSVLKRRIEMLVEMKKVRGRFGGWIQGTLAVLVAMGVCYFAEQNAAAAKVEPYPADGIIAVEPQIQKIADKALVAALERHKASMGFVVVSDPNTGRILAVANHDKVETQTERTPHWALSLRIGPASISKALSVSMAIEKGLTSPDEIFDCENARYTYGGKLYRDWKAFGKLSTAEAVIHSSNICGIKIGERLGVAGLQETWSKFGFGPGGSAENFPEARVGELPDPSEIGKQFYIATSSTGYGGVFVSPVEMVQAMGAIANGGWLLKPQQSTGASRAVIRRVLSAETSQKMKAILSEVLVSGTARLSGSKIYKLAGKTATGYSHSHVGHDSLGGESNFASFVGFGPVENPQVVVYVGVENPSDGTGVHGASHAAPTFREVAEQTLQYLKVPVQK